MKHMVCCQLSKDSGMPFLQPPSLIPGLEQIFSTSQPWLQGFSARKGLASICQSPAHPASCSQGVALLQDITALSPSSAMHPITHLVYP